MAAGKWPPVKNAAWRVTFPLLDEDGDLVTGGASDTPDTEISKDSGTFADCSNEMIEIATNSGMYFLDLNATEMDATTVAIIAKTAATATQTTPIVVYPVTGSFDEAEVDRSDIHSRLVVMDAELTVISDDVVTVAANVVLALSDTSDTLSRLVVMDAELTVISDQVASVLVDTGTTIPATLEGLVLISKASVGATGNTTTAVHLATGTGSYADNELNGFFLVLLDNGTGEWHVREITAFANTGDVATVATLPFTPATDDFYWLLSAQAGSGALTTKQDSDLTQIASDIILTLSDTSDTLSRLVVMDAELTVISDQIVTVDQDTSDVKALLTPEISDIHSRLVVMDAEITVVSDQVALVLEDTGTTIPATIVTVDQDTSDIKALLTPEISDIHSRLVVVDAELTVISDQVASVLVDTGTTIPATLEGLVLISKASVGATGNTTTAVHLATGTGSYSDDELNGFFLVLLDNGTGEWHVREITAFANTGDVATVATLPFTPATDDFYWLLSAQAGGALTTKQDSDLTEVAANVILALSDTSDTLSRLVVIDAELTVISDQVVTVDLDTSDLKALLTPEISDIHSRLVVVDAELTVISDQVASVLVDTGTTIPATLEGLVLISKASVGATGNTTTAVHLATGTGSYADNELNGFFLVLLDNGTGEWHVREITAFANTGDLATVATLPFTPATDDFYWLLSAQAGGALTTKQDSDLTEVAANVILALSDTSDTLSRLVVMDAELTIISDQVVTVDQDTSDVKALLTPEISDIHSRLVVVDAELTVISDQVASVLVDTGTTLPLTLRGLVLAEATIGSTGNDTTHVHLAGLTYGNDEINGYLVVIYDNSTDEYHVAEITDWVLSTELATMATLPFTPENATDRYLLLYSQAGSGALTAKQDSDLTLASENTTVIDQDTSDIKALLTPEISDIHSRLVVMDAELTVISDDVVLVKSDTSDTLSRLVVMDAELTVISDQVVTVDQDTSDVKALLTPEISDIHSRLVVMDAELTVISDDVVLVKSDTSDTLSRLVVMDAELTVISDQVVIVKSDTTAIHTAADAILVDTGTTLDNAISDVESSLVIVKSDLLVIESDTTRMELAMIVVTGALEGAPSSTVLQTDLAEVTNDHYNNMVFVMTSGDEAGEVRRISDYVGASGTITVDPALSGSPSSTETFAILSTAVATAGALTTKQDSDLTHIASDIIEVYSDTTAINTDTIAILVDTGTTLEARLSDVESSLVIVKSDLVLATSDLVVIDSAISDVESSLVIVKSDLVISNSDTTAINTDTIAILIDTGTTLEARLSDVESSLVIVKSDLVVATSDLVVATSDLVVISSDTAVIEAGVNVTQIGGSSTAADKLEEGAEALAIGTVNDAGASTTDFIITLTGDTISAVDDYYNGRIITFTSGVLLGQSTDILDYTGSTKSVNVTALTSAPANSVQFVIS